jgi:hypothetical protein
MNNRRKFLLQSGMAATAFLVSKPYKTFAGFCSPAISGAQDRNLVLLHTCNAKFNTEYAITANQIIQHQTAHNNAALLHAGNSIPANLQYLKYDLSQDMHSNVPSKSAGYSIIYKGHIKIAVISSGSSTINSAEEINDLASQLKKEKNCNLVVFLSQLGYKNKNSIDDITLAEGSTHIDAIIGGHMDNFSRQPMIVRNKNKAEVIIHHAAGAAFSIGKIEIDFDERGQKRRIGFGKTIHDAHAKNSEMFNA